MSRRLQILYALLFSAVLGRAQGPLEPKDYFAIQVVDEQTGRGVPMVELKTTSCLTYYTDSAGYAAFYEPGLMNRTVWFDIASHGYEFAKDGFGLRGVKLTATPGTTAHLKIKRLNIAERLYRITGEGIYRDSVLLGLKPPVEVPLLNSEVTGQDGILTAIFQGKIYWFYGDTLRAAYGLGNYSMTGATTDLPEHIDPSAGFVLNYFSNADGFTKPMAPMKGQGVVWLSGLVTFPAGDPTNMLAYYDRRLGMGEILESGFVSFDTHREQFLKTGPSVPLHSPLHPGGYPLRAEGGDGVNYIYFPQPYPNVRVRDEVAAYLDLRRYEGYTCLKPGSRQLDRDAQGKLRWTWRKNTPPFSEKEQEEYIKAGKMRRNETPWRLEDADTGKAIRLNNCSCDWNAYRKRYIMIASQQSGATMLGEVWYAEADRPEGPWIRAHKIITHANKAHDAHDFYNPSHHAFFDHDGGRVIYLEGSYVNTFSGNHQTTPLYEYNQIMYRLDLRDPRLK